MIGDARLLLSGTETLTKYERIRGESFNQLDSWVDLQTNDQYKLAQWLWFLSVEPKYNRFSNVSMIFNQVHAVTAWKTN